MNKALTLLNAKLISIFCPGLYGDISERDNDEDLEILKMGTCPVESIK
jgi:hypothetical protein